MNGAFGIAVTVIFVLMSLCYALADGADMDPFSTRWFVSPSGKWMLKRATIKFVLPLLPALLPNHLKYLVRFGTSPPGSST